MANGKAIVKSKMTDNEAKEILKLYRPGTADAEDPSFAEALALCEREPDLKNWFAEHCALYSALRAKFKQIQVPEGLREQIVAERRAHTAKAPLWQKAVILAGAAAVVVSIVVHIQTTWATRERHDFATYTGSMIRMAVSSYGRMDTNTTDLIAIRQYLAGTNAIADFALPPNLQKNAKAAGCVSMTWQGKRVSMICFMSGRPLKPNQPSDLWLFVTDNTTATHSPVTASPEFKELPEPGVITASWTIGNRTYLLATEGNKEFLNKFL